MFSRALRRRALPSLRTLNSRISTPIQRRTIVRAPKPGDGPLMERRPDRELPSVESVSFRWRTTMPIFLVLITLSSFAIFNYQKLSSPTVSSTLYALRTSRKAREYLGDEIYFAQQIPWISGSMNQLRGHIDISFRVKGNKNEGVMRFVSFRPGPKAMFETTEWSLVTKDGETIDLLDAEGGDPFKGIEGSAFFDDEDEVQQKGRGFRTEIK
ncbi:putative Cytochrome oxidase complex assembly protein 1-domain-containing protein [Seiridium cardinale]|uniref:Cytochrome oxidase complex assembly protein 1-domain-containing protein n=1 Tax=Seiridium cardinale TaxID=138064 RepID=A0ABR2Y8D0_9PEZI